MNASGSETIADIPFKTLNSISGLQQFDDKFLLRLAADSPSLHEKLLAYRQHRTTFSSIELSEFLLELAPHIESFISHIFDIEEEVQAARSRIELAAAISAWRQALGLLPQ